jgi:hypothetical protein
MANGSELIRTRFVDFQLRAWRSDDDRIQVVLHSSPAGDTPRPISVPSNASELDGFRGIVDKYWEGPNGTHQQLIEVGRRLWATLLPPAISNAFSRSLERLSSGEGLRLRLCLDRSLVDLPLEFLYRFDEPNDSPLAGFITLDPRISLVRGAPVTTAVWWPSNPQRMIFAGTFFSDPVRGLVPSAEHDDWQIRSEFEAVRSALSHIGDLVKPEFVRAANRGIEEALSRETPIFHYSGHTDAARRGAYLVRDVLKGFGYPIEGDARMFGLPGPMSFDPLYVDVLGPLLRQAKTRVAVFSACNSGHYAFVGPLVSAGVPAIIAIQGLVSTRAARTFSKQLYSSLALGLSLDEAVVGARLHVLADVFAPGHESCEWGTFMVYMPSTEAVLFPQPLRDDIRNLRETGRQALLLVVNNIERNYGSVIGASGASVQGQATVHPGGSIMPNNALVYRNFDIEITDLADNGSFRVRVPGQTPGGELHPGDAETAVYLPSDFETLLGKLERRRADPGELIALGKRLAELLLPGRVLRLYQDSMKALNEREGLRLRLRVTPLKLAALPWELTLVSSSTGGEDVPADFLALQRKVSITRYETIGAPLRPLQGKQSLRLVAALANPIGTPELDLEPDKHAILAGTKILQHHAGKDAVELSLLDPATRAGLLAALSNADLFHFAGHGVFEQELVDGKIQKRGKILLENADHQLDAYDSSELAIVLANSGVRLVVLGACKTAARDDGGAWSGVAPALVRQNVPAIVAMQWSLYDQSAAHFIAQLYTRVLAGHTIDEAVFEGRQAMFNRVKVIGRDWSAPVLYLRSEDGILFPIPEESRADDAPTVVVQRRIGTILGEDIAAEIDNMVSGQVDVSDVIDVIGPGGKSVGVKIRNLGGRS